MKKVPDISIRRLALYLRFLEDYSREKDSKVTINSEELAHFLEINPHQIRKDLSYFGKFGERGIGYRIEELKEKIANILGLNREWNICLCGMGNLGTALFSYKGFKQMRLNIVAIFDSDEKKHGKETHGIRIYGIEQISKIIKQKNIEIAIIAVPAYAAQEIADRLVKSGIRAILNFAPVKLSVREDIKLRNVDLSTEFVNLTHFLTKK